MNRVQPDTTIPKTPTIQKYVAKLTQTGTGNVIATVLENNANIEVTYERINTGQYVVTTNTPNINMTTKATGTCQQSTAGIETIVETLGNELYIYTYTGLDYVDDGLKNATFILNIYTNLL